MLKLKLKRISQQVFQVSLPWGVLWPGDWSSAYVEHTDYPFRIISHSLGLYDRILFSFLCSTTRSKSWIFNTGRKYDGKYKTIIWRISSRKVQLTLKKETSPFWSVRWTLVKEYLNETGHFMDKRAGGIQIFFDAEKDAEAMPTM